MNVLRAANETHTRHSESMGVERFFCRRQQRRMIGQPKIIVRAHVENAPSAADLDFRILRTGDDALSFVETLRFYFRERVGELLFEIQRA